MILDWDWKPIKDAEPLLEWWLAKGGRWMFRDYCGEVFIGEVDDLIAVDARPLTSGGDPVPWSSCHPGKFPDVPAGYRAAGEWTYADLLWSASTALLGDGCIVERGQISREKWFLYIEQIAAGVAGVEG